MVSSLQLNSAQVRLWLLTLVLFFSYICVAIPLPVVPVYIADQLGLSNAWAGLAVGIAFLSTIVTRGYAGGLSDRHGPKIAVALGLGFYLAGAVTSLVSGLLPTTPWAAFSVLIAGRLLVGMGESLVGVAVIAWGIGLVGPAKSGKVLALVGAAIYGALAIGGPIGFLLYDRLGFCGAMAISAFLPCLGLLAIWQMADVAPHPHAKRPSVLSIMGRVWLHGLIVFLQGIGFAAIGAFFVLHFRNQNWSYAGLGFTAFGGGFVLVRVFLGNAPDRFGGLPVAMVSLAIEAVGQLLIWGAYDPMLAFIGAFTTGLGCSLTFPAMGREVVRLVAPNLRGTALGGFTAFQDLAYGLTGPVAGLMADRAGYGSVFLIGGIAAGLGFLITAVLRRAPREPSL